MSPKINYDDLDNPFLFVVVAARRAEQLQRGALPRVTLKSKKGTTIAMVETLKHRVNFVTENAARIEEDDQYHGGD